MTQSELSSVDTAAASDETASRETTSPETGALVVQVRDLHKSFDELKVLKGVTLELRENEFVALLGRSGGGKSTLLRLLEGLDTQYEGTIAVAAERSVVFQEPRLLPWKKVWQNVAVGLRKPARELKEISLAALREVGLESKANNWPSTLSGGEAQRVGLARALVREPKLLLLDEPFGALDALTRLKMHGELKRLIAAHKPGVVLVTHDVEEALALAQRLLVLDSGEIVLDQLIDDDSRSHPDKLAIIRDKTLAALGVNDHV